MTEQTEKPVWTVIRKHVKGSTPDKNKVEYQLLANGECVHRISGLHARQSLVNYAADLNRRKIPAPEPAVKLRLDGWNQPKDLDKVPKSIPREVFNYQIP